MDVILFFGLYFLPALIAMIRKHHQSGAIFMLNMLLGWTVLGWIIALIWSVSAIRIPVKAIAALAVVTMLLTSGSVYATDAGIIAATLPNEVTECRYLEQMVKEVRVLVKEAKAFSFDTTGKTEEEKEQIYAATREIMARIDRIGHPFVEAVGVIRAKHEQMPTCFEAFADVYNLDTIR